MWMRRYGLDRRFSSSWGAQEERNDEVAGLKRRQISPEAVRLSKAESKVVAQALAVVLDLSQRVMVAFQLPSPR